MSTKKQKQLVAGVKRWRIKHPEQNRINSRKYYDKYVSLVYDHYGRVCVGCGEDDMDTLTLDHINNDGAAHRGKWGNTSWLTYQEWRQTGFWRTDIQTLCANCQLRKLRGKTFPRYQKLRAG